MSSENPFNGQQQWRLRMFYLHTAMLIAPVILMFSYFQLCSENLGKCLSQSLLKISCPGCGITSCAKAVLSGNFRQSFECHPTGPVVIGLLAILAVYFACVLFAGFRGFNWTTELKFYIVFEKMALALLVIGWAIKFIKPV